MTAQTQLKQPIEEIASNEIFNKQWIQKGFLAIAILFNLCLAIQLLTVGLALFSAPSWWQIHIWFVRSYSGLAVLLLLGTQTAPFPKRIKALTRGIVVLLLLQFVTANVQQPLPLGIFHPLAGFALFMISTTLVHQSISLLSDPSNNSPVDHLN